MPAEEFKKAEMTVVLVVRSQCTFCTDSMPFYRRLQQRAHHVSGRLRLVAVSLDPVAVGRAYLAEHGVMPDAVAPYPITTRTRVDGTPTLVAVDSSGRVVGRWTGRLSSTQEREMEAVLDAAGLKP